jgi:pyruvate dehydrogenase E1 component alpha subunit
VLAAAREAVDRARSGGGPALLELRTYRYHGHHTFELKTRLRYRDEAEVAAWRARDPVDIHGRRVPVATRRRIHVEVETLLDGAVRFALDSPAPEPDAALDHLYASGLRTRAGVSHA